MKTLLRSFSFTLYIIFFSASCSTLTYKEVFPTLQDGRYDSEFPYKGASDELKDISQTVHRINSTVFYKTYTFDKNDKLTLENIKDQNLHELATVEGYADQSSSGSGVSIYFNEGRVALLTCAHVVNYTDTIISYARDDEGNQSEYIESILIKEREAIYAAGFPEGSELEIIALDKKNDLAVIGRYYGALTNIKFPVFNYPVGRAKELEWGTFVYVFGYPVNNLMVTKAIVSSPDKDGAGTFLIDAVVNKGFSGGIVLAVRDGVPNFEFVGIIQWVPEEEENVLVPEKSKNNEPYNPIIPYEGGKYVKRFSSIKYGIARVISTETITKSLSAKKGNLYDKKYYLEKFISE